jgi:hypothetical protein
MTCNDEDHGRSRRPGAEDRGWSHRSGTRWSDDQEVRWHRVRSAPCTWRRGGQVSWLSLKTKVDGLSVVWPQNHWDDFSLVWASKPMATVCSPLCVTMLGYDPCLFHHDVRLQYRCDFQLVGFYPCLEMSCPCDPCYGGPHFSCCGWQVGFACDR